MAITIPTMDGPGVQARGMGAPQVRGVAPDTSGLELANTIGNVANGLAQKEIQRADTASIMDAEAKLSQSRLDLMFNKDTGVYGKTGVNALDITNTTLPEFDKQADSIGQSLTNDRQKAQFQSIVQHQRGQLDSELNRYEFTQRNQYYDDVDKANIATSLDGAVKYANDPSQVAYYQSKGNMVIGLQGERKGMPAEAIQFQQQQFNSQVAVSVIDRMATKDPLKAQQYYAANYQSMSAEAQDHASKVLQASVVNQMGQSMAQNVMQGSGTIGQPGLSALIMQHESGGNQTAVSPKGAIGAMQLMPDTAKETAAELGIPFDPARLSTDKNYNMALGTAYLNKMIGRYGGNNTLAVAAYNAGPGSVDKWLKEIGDPRKGEISESTFIAKIPFKETREYTASIMGKMDAPTVAKPVTATDSFDTKYARGLEAATAIANPQLKKVYLDNLDDYKKANTAKVNAVYEDAAKYVMQGGIGAVPPAVMAQVPPDEQIKLQTMDEHRRKGTEPMTDYKKMEAQLSLPPDQLAALSLEKDIQPYYSKSDFNTMRSAWQSAKTGDETPAKIAKGREDVTKTAMSMAGIEVGDSKSALRPDNLVKQQQFRSALQERTDSFKIANKGREPNVQETEDLANQLLLKVKLEGGGRLWGDKSQTLWEVQPENLSKTFLNKGDLTLDKIPPSDRREIINVLRAEGQQASEANIVARYVNRISGLGVKVK